MMNNNCFIQFSTGFIRVLHCAKQEKHVVKFVWVKGHANNPLNERCDELAVAASMQTNLQEDKGYQPE